MERGDPYSTLRRGYNSAFLQISRDFGGGGGGVYSGFNENLLEQMKTRKAIR